ncbi:MAG: alpha/beta fold hydrolase [Acidimicrobiia bacterium]|nr:alpha/beta fold hydrolase [Acidimicrobiia bacterium]
MVARYCTWTLLLLCAVPGAWAQQAQAQQAQAPVTSGYTVFLRGVPIGREDVTIEQNPDGITITGRGRLAAPLNAVTNRVAVHYHPDWTPDLLELDVNVNGGENTLKTSFLDETALSEGTLGGRAIRHTDVVGRSAFVLPNGFFGSYEAIARRLAAADIGSEHRAFIAPQLPQLSFRVSSVTTERMQTGTQTFNVRRYVLVFTSPGGLATVNLYADQDRSTLLRLNVPAQAIDVVRDDLASTASRTLMHSNPGDEPVFIPAAGFNLGATLTRPFDGAQGRPKTAAARLPAVVLIGDSPIGDRDGVVGGVPVIGQLAGALAEAGFLAVRFDKRGYGQSGGRPESATISDFAEDMIAVVRWLADRRDVDRDRIAVLGYGEGAWVALQAAARERRRIAGVVSLAAPSVTGAELVLEQQQQRLEQLDTSQMDRDAKIALQRQINAAVMTGKGWEAIPLEIRRQADTPWFQSLLSFSPARVLEDVRAPLLFLHGQLDRQIAVSHLDTIAELARAESDSKAVAVVSVRGVNHLLVPAETGAVTEYGSLTDRNVSRDVTAAIIGWLTKTFAAIR